MSSQKKTIVVFGATGAQGGSVVQSFLQVPNSPYEIRAVTRNASSPAALALSAAGVTLATADLNDAASLEAALQGAHAVFLVTDFWAPSNLARPEGEVEQGKRALDILARIPTLEHLIWSSLPSIKNVSGGKYTAVIHYDGKSEVTEYLKREHKALWDKTTELWLAPYYQIWKTQRSFFGPKRVETEGGEIFVQANAVKKEVKLPMVNVLDTGIVVAAILEKGGEVQGKTVSMVGDDTRTQLDYLTTWGKHVGKTVQHQQIPEKDNLESLKAAGFPEYLVKDLSELPAAFQEFEGAVYKGEGIIMANEILPEAKKLGSWEEYVKGEEWEEYLKE